MSEERTEPAVPSFKARLAMFNQPQAESTGSPPPKPTSKPREWKRPTPPTETPSETPHSQTDPQGGPARDFSATDAKACEHDPLTYAIEQ